MAVATSFPESDAVLDKPADMSRDECDPLSIARVMLPSGHPMVVSCWKLTREELDEVVRTGRVWLGVLGLTMPPVIVTGIKPFEAEQSE